MGADVLVKRTSLTNIADAIRAKGQAGTFTPAEMAIAISEINTGVTHAVVGPYLAFLTGDEEATVSGTKITAIGTYSDHKLIIE